MIFLSEEFNSFDQEQFIISFINQEEFNELKYLKEIKKRLLWKELYYLLKC